MPALDQHLSAIYRRRFVAQTGLQKRNRVWRVLCANFFDDLVGPHRDVLDLACGYGEFINHVRARHKTAIDLNPDAKGYLAADVDFVRCPATALALDAASQDVVFTSNFLEHLRDKDEVATAFREVCRALRPGGWFILLGPNIKYTADVWQLYT